MTETEFFQGIDKILLNNTGNISTLIKEYNGVYNTWYDTQNLVDNLAEYLNKKGYHLSLEQVKELWNIAGDYDSKNLIDTLLKIQHGKCSSNNLIQLLKTNYYKKCEGFDYIFDLTNKYPDSYQYEPDDNLYKLLTVIIDCFERLQQNREIFCYFLNILKSLPTFQRDLNQLIYYFFFNDNEYSSEQKMLKILIEFGADPFANYYEGDIDTGVPIVFKVIHNGIYCIKPLLKYKRKLKNWNITDEWGRNLLHYVTDRQEIYEKLLKNGIDPDHKALIDDEAKVVIAKMKGTLPKEYGKTPRELIKF